MREWRVDPDRRTGKREEFVLNALCTLLEIDEVPFSAIESELFSRGYPWLSCGEWIPQLAALVRLQYETGRRTFLVAATTETADELRAVRAAVDADRQLVVCLHAPPELVAARVAAREPDAWPGKVPLIEHARTLAERIPAIPGIDLVTSTVSRIETDVAREIRGALAHRAIVP